MTIWVIKCSEWDNHVVVGSLKEAVERVNEEVEANNWFDGDKLEITITTEEHSQEWLDALDEEEIEANNRFDGDKLEIAITTEEHSQESSATVSTVTWASVTGATSYNLYRSTTAAGKV